MARSIADIEKELMALPTEERARLVRKLIRSLGKDKETLSRKKREAAWLEEVKRRDAEIDSGRETMLRHEEVITLLKSVIH